MGLQATIFSGISASQTGPTDLASGSAAVNVPVSLALANGTGTNQVDRMFSDQRTLTASTSEDLDLAGILTDAFGVTITFVKVKAIWIKASSANTNNVVVGAASSADFVGPWSTDGTTSIPPGGSMLVSAPVSGWTVTATTADILKIANSSSGTSVIYNLVIIGTSA